LCITGHVVSFTGWLFHAFSFGSAFEGRHVLEQISCCFLHIRRAILALSTEKRPELLPGNLVPFPPVMTEVSEIQPVPAMCDPGRKDKNGRFNGEVRPFSSSAQLDWAPFVVPNDHPMVNARGTLAILTFKKMTVFRIYT
jgi:hypothetical protein